MKANGLEFPLKRSPGLNTCCEGGVRRYTRFTLQYRTWLRRIEIFFFSHAVATYRFHVFRFHHRVQLAGAPSTGVFTYPDWRAAWAVSQASLFARVDGPLLKANTKTSLETLVTSTYRGRKVAQSSSGFELWRGQEGEIQNCKKVGPSNKIKY